MNLHIEAVENERNWSYGFSLEILNSSVPDTVNIKFDNGAGYTVISASVFLDELTDSAAERIEKKLREREASRSGSSSINAAPFRMKFQSATGDLMTGYLADAGEVKLGEVRVPHFYYYFVPQNDRPIALLGNDFLRYCEYTHTIEGNIYITKMDEDAYAKHYINAMSVDELAAVIDEIEQDNTDDFGNR